MLIGYSKQDNTHKIEGWTGLEDLNPKMVETLGYRSNTDIILDFIRSGVNLTKFREEGYTDSEDCPENYFDAQSYSVDNLNEFKQDLDDFVDSKNEELSTLSTREVVENSNDKELSTSSLVREGGKLEKDDDSGKES